MGLGRYIRLFAALARFSLARELAFRSNFLIKISVELLWLGILLTFYKTVFTKTSVVAEWTEAEYLFFVGCYFALEGLIETLFLENCNEFAELIRNGDLDFFLLKPIDEQFLLTCRGIDFSTAPNVLLGAGVMGIALHQLHWQFNWFDVLWAVLTFAAGLGIAYSFLLLLMSTSVWLLRNQSLLELWWLFTSVMRYPKEIYAGRLASPLGWFFTFVVPMLLVVNVPSRIMVKVFDPTLAGFTVGAAVLFLFVSRRFFRLALRRYRSASS